MVTDTETDITQTDSAHGRQSNSRHRSILQLLAAFVLAVGGLYALYGRSTTDFNAFALDAQTKSIYGRYQGDLIHCSTFDDAMDCLGPARDRRLSRSVIWLGNSQLHAVNQLKEGQANAAEILVRHLRPEGVEVLAFSQPNASLAEHLVMFEGLRQHLKPSVLVLPLVFDDTRETGIRDGVAKALSTAAVKARIGQGTAGAKIIEQTSAQLAREKRPEELSTQERSEKAITSALEACCGWETLRLEARGAISIFLYRTRNALFGIKATTKRKKLPAAYDLNLAAYEQLLASARASGISVLTYIAPLRADAPRPYVTEEYEAFKRDAAAVALRMGARHVDLETAVPDEFWGMKDATGADSAPELDFMHFQARGHEMLEARVAAAVKELLQ